MPRARAGHAGHGDHSGPVETDNRLFISYSRRDQDRVREFCEGLATRGIGTWVDWEDIPPSAAWWDEIRRGIDAADAFAFVISPDAIASRVCADELAHAVAAGKRLLPVVARDPAPDVAPPEALARLNWIFARAGDALDDALDRFVLALGTDLELLRMHARVLVRAREWLAAARNASYLLRGADLDDALRWLSAVGASGPMPTALHREYLLASQQAQREEGEKWHRLYQESMARELAAQSQLLVDQRGTSLPLAGLLALEAARRAGGLHADQALRKVLHLLPLRHARVALAGGHVCVADAAPRLAASSGRRIEVWDLDRGARIAGFDTDADVHAPGRSRRPMALTPDGRVLAALAGDDELHVWRVDEGAPLLHHRCGAPVVGVALARDGTRAVVTLEGPSSLLVDLAGGEAPRALAHEQPMLDAAWHPAQAEIVFWGEQSAEFWDPARAERRSSLPLGLGGGTTMQWTYSPRGEYLAVVQRRTYEVNVFHVPTRRRVLEEKRHVAVAFHPQDESVALASPEWIAQVFALPKGNELYRMRHDDSVWNLGYSGDGRRLWTGSGDGTTRVWELERRGDEVARIVHGAQGTRDAAFSADGWRLHRVLEGGFETLDARGFDEWRMFDLRSPVFAVDASPAGRQIAIGCRNGTWLVAGYDNDAEAEVVAAQPGRNAMGEQVTEARFVTPRHLLLRRASGPPWLRDLPALADQNPFTQDGDVVLDSSRTGEVFVARQGRLHVWDAAQAAWRRGSRALPAGLRAAAASADGNWLAVLGERAVRLLPLLPLLRQTRRRPGDSAAARRPAVRLEGETALALDTAGTRLALWRSGDDSSAIRIVDTAGGRTLARWSVPSRLQALAFDAAGEHVVLALKDASVQVWHAATATPRARMRHAVDAVTACFARDEGFVASGSWDGTARLWCWRSEALVAVASARLDRDLTPAEWAQYLPNEPYRATRMPVRAIARGPSQSPPQQERAP